MANPIKPTLKTEILPISFLILSVIASFYFYAEFPERVPIHWNYQGETDNYSGKAFGAFFFPILNLGLYLLFLGLPHLDPNKKRYEQFSKVYHLFKGVLVGFMTFIYFLASTAALGYPVSIGYIMPLSIGLLFVVLGNYMSKIKPNWFMGIRTPWTLSNEEVWNKTHRIGGKIFIAIGLIMIIGSFLPIEGYWNLFPWMIILFILIPLVYSYLLYRKIEKK